VSFRRLRTFISQVWIKINLEWTKAAEIQARIDQAKLEQLQKRMGAGWPI
jgi:hypothetical protein